MCRFHGGESPNALAKAAQREAEQRAGEFLATLEYAPLQDPLGELMKIASEAIEAKNYFKTQIEELRYKGQTGEQLRSEVALWERAMDRCDKVLSNIVRLGIAERVARVREAEVQLMSEALDRTFDRLGLSPAQRVEADVIVIEELEAVSAEKTRA